MSKEKQCIDFYGEKLKIGDEVIPILEEALIIGINGFISKIEYSEKYNNHYITITDKDGNVLLENVDARCYTTQARFDEREDFEYVYDLTFYNKSFWPLTAIPLTNRTDSDYEIPDGTYFVILGANHLEEEKENSSLYTSYSIYHFIIDGKCKLYHEETENFYYLVNSETNASHMMDSNYRIFKNDEELKKYVKSIIEYFNNADLTHVNNNKEFDKNDDGKEFEKKLINHLKN